MRRRRRVSGSSGSVASRAMREYGDPVQELGRYGASVDLLVLGSHRRGPVGRRLGRGTAQRLADEAVCPLLVVPQDAGASLAAGMT